MEILKESLKALIKHIEENPAEIDLDKILETFKACEKMFDKMEAANKTAFNNIDGLTDEIEKLKKSEEKKNAEIGLLSEKLKKAEDILREDVRRKSEFLKINEPAGGVDELTGQALIDHHIKVEEAFKKEYTEDTGNESRKDEDNLEKYKV